MYFGIVFFSFISSAWEELFFFVVSFLCLFSGVFFLVCFEFDSSASTVDCLERLVSKMNYFVLSGT